MQKRVGLKPLLRPHTGTYWRATRTYADSYSHKPPVFVAVTGTERKYARMGMQTAFVKYVSAELYATTTYKQSDERHLDYEEFFSVFEEVIDQETLSSELGMAILAMYD